jgi:hypothetical protein
MESALLLAEVMDGTAEEGGHDDDACAHCPASGLHVPLPGEVVVDGEGPVIGAGPTFGKVPIAAELLEAVRAGHLNGVVHVLPGGSFTGDLVARFCGAIGVSDACGPERWGALQVAAGALEECLQGLFDAQHVRAMAFSDPGGPVFVGKSMKDVCSWRADFGPGPVLCREFLFHVDDPPSVWCAALWALLPSVLAVARVMHMCVQRPPDGVKWACARHLLGILRHFLVHADTVGCTCDRGLLLGLAPERGPHLLGFPKGLARVQHMLCVAKIQGLQEQMAEYNADTCGGTQCPHTNRWQYHVGSYVTAAMWALLRNRAANKSGKLTKASLEFARQLLTLLAEMGDKHRKRHPHLWQPACAPGAIVSLLQYLAPNSKLPRALFVDSATAPREQVIHAVIMVGSVMRGHTDSRTVVRVMGCLLKWMLKHWGVLAAEARERTRVLEAWNCFVMDGGASSGAGTAGTGTPQLLHAVLHEALQPEHVVRVLDCRFRTKELLAAALV